MQIIRSLPPSAFQRNTPVPFLVAPDKWRMIKLATTEAEKKNQKERRLIYTEMIERYHNII